MKDKIIQQGWEVEDAFFGALLGAVFGTVIQNSPWYAFPILVAFLGGIVVCLKEAFQHPKGWKRWEAYGDFSMFTILGSIFLYLLGAFKFSHSFWLIMTIMIWAILKFRS
ncbi:MAG: hypothetical protein AB1397_04150 [bacterium]